MTVLQVPEMSCEHCVARISKALKEENIDFTISLGEKVVTIHGDESKVSKAIDALDDIGYESHIDE